MHPFLFGYDFYYLWSVGTLVHHGLDPYNTELLRQQLYSLGWPAQEVPQTFTHPFNTLWLYWLLAILPFKASLFAWSCISIGLIAVSTLILARILVANKPLSPLLAVFATAIFPPTLGTLIYGQINAVLLFGIAIFAFCWSRDRFFYAGLGLSLVLIKPHIFGPFLLVIFVWEFLAKRFSCLAGCVSGLLLQIGASCAIAPDCIAWYRGALEGILSESMLICGATLGQLIECKSGLRMVRPLLLVSGSIAALCVTKARGYTLLVLLSLVLPLSVCVSPYCWMHSLVVLIPGLLLLGSSLTPQISERTMRYAMAVAAAATLPMIVGGGMQAVWILLSWGIFLGGFYATHGDGTSFKRLFTLSTNFCGKSH